MLVFPFMKISSFTWWIKPSICKYPAFFDTTDNEFHLIETLNISVKINSIFIESYFKICK